MCGRMPVDFQRFGISILEQAKVGIFFQRLGKVDEVAVGFGDERGIGESRADRFRNFQRSRTFGNLLHASVRELYMNAVWHKLNPAGETESFSLLKRFRRVKPGEG